MGRADLLALLCVVSYCVFFTFASHVSYLIVVIPDHSPLLYFVCLKHTEPAFLDLHLSISNDIVSTKIYDKCDDFDFEMVNFPF